MVLLLRPGLVTPRICDPHLVLAYVREHPMCGTQLVGTLARLTGLQLSPIPQPSWADRSSGPVMLTNGSEQTSVPAEAGKRTLLPTALLPWEPALPYTGEQATLLVQPSNA